MTLYDIVIKLTGQIDPVGETNEDNRRFENLKEMTTLVNELIKEIKYVAKRKDRYEDSIKKAGKYADSFLTEELQIVEDE